MFLPARIVRMALPSFTYPQCNWPDDSLSSGQLHFRSLIWHTPDASPILKGPPYASKLTTRRLVLGCD